MIFFKNIIDSLLGYAYFLFVVKTQTSSKKSINVLIKHVGPWPESVCQIPQMWENKHRFKKKEKKKTTILQAMDCLMSFCRIVYV